MLHNFKYPDAVTAHLLENSLLLTEIEHRSGKSIGHADCMPRLTATTAAFKTTTTLDVDGQTQPSQNLPPSNSQTRPAQQSHSTTRPRDTDKINQTDDEQSDVEESYEARAKKQDEQSEVRNGNTIGENKSNQTDDQQSDVRNGNTAGENRSNHTDDQQPEVQYGHEAGENEAVSQFTLIEQQTDLLDFPYSVAHCNSANIKLGAGLAKQIKEKLTSYFPPKNEKATNTARTVLG